MERVRFSWMEVRHLYSRTAWASCPSGTCSDCQVLAALALERWWAESPLSFASGDSRKRWPGPGRDESLGNSLWSAERRAALIMRVAAVPGNGGSSGLCLATGAVQQVRRSALRFPRYRGKQKGNASVEAKPSRTRDTAPMHSHRENAPSWRHCRASPFRRGHDY
jgi:hypothetical protein